MSKKLLMAAGLMLAASATVSLFAGYTQGDLFDAVRKGKSHNISRALRGGVDVNVTGPEGNTALHIAAQRDSGHGADILLEAKDIDVNALNRAGRTALDLARRNSHAYRRIARKGGRHSAGRRRQAPATAAPATAAPAASRSALSNPKYAPLAGESKAQYSARMRKRYPNTRRGVIAGLAAGHFPAEPEPEVEGPAYGPEVMPRGYYPETAPKGYGRPSLEEQYEGVSQLFGEEEYPVEDPAAQFEGTAPERRHSISY